MFYIQEMTSADYASRKERGRAFVSIEDSLAASVRGLETTLERAKKD